MISSQTIREKFLQFFREKGHAIIPSSSILPENDPTVLFTTAGMHPLVPYLLGEKHPLGKKLVDFQKCVRTGDIDSVGDQWHLTCFEMLGNWSLGDYFKKEAIAYSFEFLTSKKWLGLDKERIHVTCFIGDKDCPKDIEAASEWKKQGIPEERIHFLPKSDNWWGPAGQTGPCGPCTEMFYDTRQNMDLKGKTPTEKFVDGSNKGRFVEIWNDVFMQYNKTAEGKFVPLKQQNVDTGMGLERTTAVLNGLNSNYETDLFEPVMKEIVSLSKTKNVQSQRIIADHLRATTFMLGDSRGISPSNVDQGYVLRRLIRRAVRHGRLLGIKHNFTSQVAKAVVKRFSSIYPELKENEKRIEAELEKEESKFRTTLEKGLQILNSEIDKRKMVDAKTAFDLYQSYGFPIEMTEEIAAEKGLKVDQTSFHAFLAEHQQKSRKGAEQKFKGGLADNSEEVTRLHTATHLLNAALKQVLGTSIHQKGSNITNERLRFDFSYEKKMTSEQLKKVEEIVNKAILRGFEVKFDIVPLLEAKKLGAEMLFGEKYGENVKVYTVWDPKTKEVFSREFCGGPHVSNTKEIGKFKILKEEGVAAGVRRIKAVVG